MGVLLLERIYPGVAFGTVGTSPPTHFSCSVEHSGLYYRKLVFIVGLATPPINFSSAAD